MHRPNRGWRGARRSAPAPRPQDLLFVQRAERADSIVVEIDRPQAFRPRLVGFWRDNEFYLITRMVATRREHDAIYHRVVTDHGAFDLRYIRRMHPLTLRPRRHWEVCAELDVIPIARLG
jgi:hypothetical protein